MYLGPVVATQQVLDPSPQNCHPRKEKKGGGAHPLQPSLQESNPRVFSFNCIIIKDLKVVINLL